MYDGSPPTPADRKPPGSGPTPLWRWLALLLILILAAVVFFRQFGDRVSTSARSSGDTIDDNIEATSTGQPWNYPEDPAAGPVDSGGQPLSSPTPPPKSP